MKVRQKDIRNLIKWGKAENVTNWSGEEIYKLMDGAESIERLYYSVGVYGCNGAAVNIDGKLYATACRCANMLILL